MAVVARAYRIGMRVPFRGLTAREGLLLHGPAGWGEFSPFPEYGPDVTRSWLAAAREAADEGWPDPVRSRIPVNTTVPAVAPDRAWELVKSSGCTTAKVKVGDATDEPRLEAVRDALGPRGKLRIDVNGNWDVDGAVRWINRLARFDLEYVEQPVATLAEMRDLRRRVDVPLAIDESLRTAPDPLAVRLDGAADIVVLKVQPLGGVKQALRVADATGLPAVVSSALESSIGIAAGVALAAALPELPYACGLGTVSLLEGDVVMDPLLPNDGHVEVRSVSLAEDLGGHEIDPGQWLQRMRALD